MQWVERRIDAATEFHRQEARSIVRIAQRRNPIHPNNENVRHEIEMPTLPKSRRAALTFDYVCGTNNASAPSKADCKIEILFRCVKVRS